MLAYRHAFHAGNHGDVLKHLVLVQVLRHMALKDKAYTLVDTHAGAGGYALASRYAQQTGEHEAGIGRLYGRDDLPPALADLVGLVREFNAGGALEQYPGSPALAQMLLRRQDRLRLYELHPTDHRILHAFVGERPHTEVRMEDGFAALSRELPPPSRRGVVLVDPSYELKSDYAKVVAALRETIQSFATGTMIVWYPQVGLLESAQLPRRLSAAAAGAPKGWLHASLQLMPPAPGGFGMTGSGVFVLNPPWPLQQALRECLPYLVQVLGQHDKARFVLDVAET
jgi:23S rRNA (adenine2030-N6)-methyltransferase